MVEKDEQLVAVPSVEVYLPWNDTWYSLPELPTLTDDRGRKWNMTDTHLMTLGEGLS